MKRMNALARAERAEATGGTPPGSTHSFTKVTHRAAPVPLKALAYWKVDTPKDVYTWGRRRDALLDVLARYEAGGLSVIVNDLGWSGGWELAVGFETITLARNWARRQDEAGLKGEGEPDANCLPAGF